MFEEFKQCMREFIPYKFQLLNIVLKPNKSLCFLLSLLSYYSKKNNNFFNKIFFL